MLLLQESDKKDGDTLNKNKNALKIPMYIFAFSATVLLTFQTTFLLVNDFWQRRVTDMVATDRTALSESLTSLDGIVKSKSVYAADTASLIDGAMGGYLSGLGDRYAMYMNSEQYSDYIAASAQGSSVGIGISSLYDSSKDGIYVVNVYADSPAQKAGIVPGDTITSVNGVAVSESGFYGAMLKIGSGEAYSSVLLKVRKSDGTSEDITVPRDIVSVNNVSTRIIHDNVGVISISEFTGTVTDDFKKCAEELIKNGADRFIIDIRNNPGGDTDNVASLLDFILPDGTTITGADRDGSAKTYKSDVNQFSYPMTVLVNRNTVCGAELFAAAMKDFGRASLVGETTYGKATVQSIFPLSDGAASFSTMLFTTPSGSSFDGDGIAPDYEISQRTQVSENGEITDAQLEKAAEVVLAVQDMSPANQ